MLRFKLLLLIIIGASLKSFAQDVVIINEEADQLNTSITSQFTLYESEEDLTFVEFIDQRLQLEQKKLERSIENLDFTSSHFYIYFRIENQTKETKQLVLETARPITNGVHLKSILEGKMVESGDGIPFSRKSIRSNKSVLPIELQPGQRELYILELSSDGEIISLPMIFWEKDKFEINERSHQFSIGIFYGIFLFVIIIYTTFYVLLKDRLFFLYTAYVLFSGLLQFALDGYIHEFVLTSGGYTTQHSVIFIAGITVWFALRYATRYLALEGRLRKIALGFSGIVLITVGLSLIPGKIYEICYPLINGFSLLAVIFLLLVAIRVRKHNASISRLFLLGLFSLLVGAVIFILGNFSVIDYPALTQNSLKAGTLVEIICLSILMAGKYKSLQDEKEKAQLQLLSEMEAKNILIEETNVRLESEVKERTSEIEQQRKLLKTKNEDFVSSIKYAERIQSALLSNEQKFKSHLPNSFVIFRPKDIVSGDFYWIEHIDPAESWPEGLTVYATADCTGHGVPGAFVSIICNNLLKLGKTHKDVNSPGEALDFVDREINSTLNTQYSDEQIRDGMDVALCAIDRHSMTLNFAGANSKVYISRKGELIEVKGDRKAIGNTHDDKSGFNTSTVPIESGDILYTFSDGIVDQFGGPQHKKFGTKRLKELLLTATSLSLEEQQRAINDAFDQWKQDEEQIDDVLFIGVQID
ncbi:MAG: 7TM diverse intracellular signaling domain-containing protein [Crocinitomicaceae bacterium]|nr:7TM diverse intracellular signaling domain-containing protein [Crocinitomicaceae bacterium]